MYLNKYKIYFLYIEKLSKFIMKYISSRKDFLRKSKNTNDFLLETKGNLRLITEEAPFENDISWSDSLLGRLIYHQIIQRIEDTSKMIRIQPVINRLESELLNITSESYFWNVSDELKKEIDKAKLNIVLQSLKKSIEENESLDIIKANTKVALEEIEKSNINEKTTIKEELLILQNFLVDKKEDTKEKEEEQEISIDESINENYILNLKSLRGILEGFPSFENLIKSNKEKIHNLKESLIKETPNVKLITQINNLLSPKVKDVIIDTKLINSLLTENQDKINNLYHEVKEFITGNKKNELTLTKNDIITETNTEVGTNLGSKSKHIISIDGHNVYISNIAWKIAKFLKFSLQFDQKNLTDQLGVLSKNIKEFNRTGKLIIQTNENKLYNFTTFINENTEPTEEEGTLSEKINNFFSKNCSTTRNYVLDKAEFDKIQANVEKLKDESDGLIINGIDPIIQICRLFNKAYRLYTRASVSQRKDGTLAPSLRGRYTSLSGSETSGPFRINKIFYKWNDAVLKLMGDRRFEYIFSKDTKIRFPKVPNPDPNRKEDWEVRKGAGLMLNKFMRDLLDGDKMYREMGGGDGAQKKLLEDYFGKFNSKVSELGDKEDLKVNPKNAEAIEKAALNLSFKTIEKSTWSENTFFSIKYKSIENGLRGDKSKYYYGMVLPGSKSIVLSRTFKYLKEIVDKAPLGTLKDGMTDGRQKKIDKGELPLLEMKTNYTDKNVVKYYQNKYLKGSLSSLSTGKKVALNYITGLNNTETKSEEIYIEGIYWLSKVDAEKFKVNIDSEWLKKQKTSATSKSPFITDTNNWLSKTITNIKIVS